MFSLYIYMFICFVSDIIDLDGLISIFKVFPDNQWDKLGLQLGISAACTLHPLLV